MKLRAPNGRAWVQPVGLFINNEFVASSNPANIIFTIDPATEKEICQVQAATIEDVDRAVAAARAALKGPAWKNLDVTERGKMMFKLADLIEENKELLATIDAWDNGTGLFPLKSQIVFFSCPPIPMMPSLTISEQVSPTTSPSQKTCLSPSTPFATTRAGPTRYPAKLSVRLRKSLPTPFASQSA